MTKDRRIEFHATLTDLLRSAVPTNLAGEPTRAYFQPPPTVMLKYPCIVYSRSLTAPNHADDMLYKFRQCYSVTYIDPNPDSDVHDALLALPYCQYDRHFTQDNLHHDMYYIYH